MVARRGVQENIILRTQDGGILVWVFKNVYMVIHSDNKIIQFCRDEILR